MRSPQLALPRRLKPTNGFPATLHFGLVLILPVIVFVLVHRSFVQLALLIIVLSKWRMFAVKPRFWAANIRANAVDLMVGLSAVIFMSRTDSLAMQALWAVLYAGWLLIIKPRSTVLWVAAQAFIGQLSALSALYLWHDGPVVVLTLGSGLFCFLAARHFFDIFDEPYARLLSFIWGYFGAALAWVLSHWLLFYNVVAQPTLLLSVLGYGLAGLYYLDHYEKLAGNLRKQVLYVMVAVVVVIVAFSGWGNKAV